MIPNVKKLMFSISGTDSTGIKHAFPLSKKIRVLDSTLWIVGTEATALVIKVGTNNVVSGLTTTVLATHTLAAADNSGKVSIVDVDGVEVERGKILEIEVTTASTANKAGYLEINYIEEDQLQGSLTGVISAAT